MRPLGSVQREVLGCLIRHKFWSASGCGWVWNTPGGTARIMDTLVNRGFAIKLWPDGGFTTRVVYKPTDAGRKALK